MSGQKNINRMLITFPQLLFRFPACPGSAPATGVCRGLCPQTTAQHALVPTSGVFCTGGREMQHNVSSCTDYLLCIHVKSPLLLSCFIPFWDFSHNKRGDLGLIHALESPCRISLLPYIRSMQTAYKAV